MDNQDNSSNNGGIYSKFQERLRKIKLSRVKKRKQNDAFIQERVQEIREVLSKEPPIYSRAKGGFEPETDVVVSEVKDEVISDVIVNIKSTAEERNYGNRKPGVGNGDENIVVTGKDSSVKDGVEASFQVVSSNTSILSKESTIKDGNTKTDNDSLKEMIGDIRENRPKARKSKRVGYVSEIKKDSVKNISDEEKAELLTNLGAEILDKIKLSFEDKLDEIEVLASELYILSQKQDNELELKKVNDIKKKINELIDKINVLVEQYNLYKRNYYIDNVIGIDDNVIVDDIINYRELLDSFEDEKRFVKEYKALEEFKSLYSNLKEVRDETERLQLSNNEKIEEFQIRDKKYNNVKLEMVAAVGIDKKCSEEINRQNDYFDRLMSRVSVIDSREYVTLHMRGIGELVGQSLRYMGLLMLSPLSGLVPSISMQTFATRRMIGNAYHRLHLEEVRHVRYEAVNYDSEISQHLNDVDYADNLIDDTLGDVERLKEDFMRIYNSKIPGYEDTLKKIGEIENKLYRNQNRLSIIKKNLRNSKKINEDKLKKVRELNYKQN